MAGNRPIGRYVQSGFGSMTMTMASRIGGRTPQRSMLFSTAATAAQASAPIIAKCLGCQLSTDVAVPALNLREAHMTCWAVMGASMATSPQSCGCTATWSPDQGPARHCRR
eukprot:10866742-Alexandrium_andersonii.AAC.1